MIVGLVVGMVVGLALGGAVVFTVSAGRQDGAPRRPSLGTRRRPRRGRGRDDPSGQPCSTTSGRWPPTGRPPTAEARELAAGVFADLSTKALEQNNAQFLALADARLMEARQAAQGDLDQRRQSIEQMLTPLADQLGRYEQSLRLLELERQRAYTGLSDQVGQLAESQQRLQSETRNLVDRAAVAGHPGPMGRDAAAAGGGDGGHARALRFRRAGPHREARRAGCVPTWSSICPAPSGSSSTPRCPCRPFSTPPTPPTTTARKTHLVSHARQLRTHVDALSKKSYWQQFDDSPEFVIAFIPGDPLLAAALEHDSSLLEHAVAHHVLLATPTTLIGLLRAVAYGWQQDALAENAREVQQIGRELYKRLATFGEHMARTGRSLSGAVDAYNKAVGSLERNVMPQARRFQELGVGGRTRRCRRSIRSTPWPGGCRGPN